jgi:hypothetical protein
VSAYAEQIAQREAELAELDAFRRKQEALANRPAELRDEIDALRRQEVEQVGAAEARYLNSHAPFIEARDEALAQLTKLADAIEKARDTYAEVDAAYRVLVNLGVEPETPKPERSDMLAMRDRELHREFERLTEAVGSRW